MLMMRKSLGKRRVRKVERLILSKTYGAGAMGSVVHVYTPPTAGCFTVDIGVHSVLAF
jgi:hypothetical protein